MLHFLDTYTRADIHAGLAARMAKDSLSDADKFHYRGDVNAYRYLIIMGRLNHPEAKQELSSCIMSVCSHRVIELARLVKSLGVFTTRSPFGWNWMLWWAARNESPYAIELARLAKEWGADDWNGMSCRAAMNKSPYAIDLVRLAKSWGADDWNGTLYSAAMNESPYAIKLVRLAKEWGANNWNEMLYCAARNESPHAIELARLAKEWGANDWDGMLRNARRNKSSYGPDLVRLAKLWSASATRVAME